MYWILVVIKTNCEFLVNQNFFSPEQINKIETKIEINILVVK